MPCRTRGSGLDVEGLGIVFLEAAASGLPVIAGDPAAHRRRFSPGVPGPWWTAATWAQLAQAAIDLLTDRDTGDVQWGANGRDWVSQTWNWDRSAERLAALLSG